MNHKELSLFFLVCSLFSMLPLGYSIRDYYDKSDYIKLGITIGLCVIMIYIGRFFYKIAFATNKLSNKQLHTKV